MSIKKLGLTLLGLSFVLNANAESVFGVIPEHIKRQNIEERLKPYGNNLLGDSLDISTGTVSFNNLDVSIPGNFDLPVSISRRFETGYSPLKPNIAIDYKELPRGPRKAMVDWDIDIPSVRWVHPVPLFRMGTQVTPKESTRNFCDTDITEPAIAMMEIDGDIAINEYGHIEHYDLSNGMDLYIPGVGTQKLLDSPTRVKFPKDVIKVTKDYWTAKCIDANDGAQGLLITSPNGTTYQMDHFYYAPEIGSKINFVYVNNAISLYDGTITVPRVTSTLMVSKVTDIHGNWVKYEYSGALLSRIHSSDHREIEVTYEEQKIKTVEANNRIWTYEYSKNNSNNEYLSAVVRPDSKRWTYDFGAKPVFPIPQYGCESDDVTITATHPSGAIGKFTFAEKVHIKATTSALGVTYPCFAKRLGVFKVTSYYDVMSLTSKTLSGPGITSTSWSFNYQEKSQGEPSTKWSESIDPSGARTRHTFHVDGELDTLKKSEEVFNPAGKRLRKNEYSYVTEQAVGETSLLNEPQPKFVNPRHQSNVTTTQYYAAEADVYATILDYNTDETSTNYSFGAPTLITESNNLDSGNEVLVVKKQTKKQYANDLTTWQLRKPTTTTISSNSEAADGGETSKYEYYDSSHPTYANLLAKQSTFGTWQHQYKEYHGDGNVKQIDFNKKLLAADGSGVSTLNRYVSFNDFKRGVLTSMTLPNRTSDTDSNKISATREVDDNGWVTSVTDFNGVEVEYGYDDIGRLKYVDPFNTEEADTYVSWTLDLQNRTVRTSKRCTLNTARNGCEDTPLITSTITYDALLRPVLIKSQDAESTVYINKAYDFNNQVTFESFPSISSSEIYGTNYVFDELSRLKTTTTTGGGTVKKDYLNDNQIRVTDAKGNATTTKYVAYGSPSYGQAIEINSPESVVTQLDVDVLGNIKSIKQSSALDKNIYGHTEYRAYDSNKRLCQINRSDVGATVFNLNAIGEVIWTASGQTAASNTACNVTVNATNKINFTYDNLGIQRTINYGDGTPSKTFTYDNNSNVKSISTSDYTQNYNYNSYNLLRDEQLNIDGKNFKLLYEYNPLGALNAITYPGSLPKIDFNVNGFGQATQAIRSYSSSSRDEFVKGGTGKASYHPNGTIDTFTYGNGVVHKTSLNIRNIPEQITDKYSGVDHVNLSYSYDDNLNVTSIINTREGGIHSLYDLKYDGLDRLKSTTGGRSIGSSAITYDGLGNIKNYANNSALNPSSLTYQYDDSKNRLMAVTDSHSSEEIRDFDYDNRGNVVHNGKRGFKFNIANELVSSGASGFIYDGYGRRIKKINDKGEIEYSVYGQSGKLFYRQNDSGETNYVFLGSKLVAKEGTGIDIDANSIMNYKPFGESIEESKDEVGYTGHKFDKELGLSYMQARYYDPMIGRFYSNDPVGFKGVHSFNRYAYVSNNPYKYTDPDGKEGVAIRQDMRVKRLISDEITAKQYSAENRAEAIGGLAGVAVLATRGAILAVAKVILTSKKDTVVNQVVSATKEGAPRIKQTFSNGRTADITAKRVKEGIPNTHPNAPAGAMQKVKFKNSQAGSKGFKRDPTPAEIKLLDKVQ